jgi:hypothetical protein
MQQTTLLVNYKYCIEHEIRKVYLSESGIILVYVQHEKGLENFHRELVKVLNNSSQVTKVNKMVENLPPTLFTAVEIEKLKSMGHWKNFQVIQQETIDLL